MPLSPGSTVRAHTQAGACRVQATCSAGCTGASKGAGGCGPAPGGPLMPPVGLKPRRRPPCRGAAATRGQVGGGGGGVGGDGVSQRGGADGGPPHRIQEQGSCSKPQTPNLAAALCTGGPPTKTGAFARHGGYLAVTAVRQRSFRPLPAASSSFFRPERGKREAWWSSGRRSVTSPGAFGRCRRPVPVFAAHQCERENQIRAIQELLAERAEEGRVS